ncbi:glycerophosphodiester phosphodiesterase 1 [Cotesia glomerata]|nr:glycerophosphodiester phosphodiesterase 1 [Cotesia glomerata]
MSGILKTLFDSASLWIYLQAFWYILISILYYFSIPWILWGTLIIVILSWVLRNPPPDKKIINKVLGVDPSNLKTTDDKLTLLSDNHHHNNNSINNGDKLTNNEFCMRVIGHRGGGYDYPENSLSAFNNCKAKGCNTVEIDLRRTKDNIPIIFHDETIERLTGKIGVIKDMTWDELKDLDISYNHPLRETFKGGERILSFNEAIEQCLNNDLNIVIDVKDSNLDFVQIILDAYKKYPKLYEKAWITSCFPVTIYMIRRRDPKIVTCLAFEPKVFLGLAEESSREHGLIRTKSFVKNLLIFILDILHEWALTRFTYFILGISCVLLHKDIISPHIIEEWKSRGVRVIAWPINLPSEKIHYTKTLKVTYLTDTLLTEKIT